MARVFVSIGSNIDKEKNISSSVSALQELYEPLDISNVYETEAIGFKGDNFHNLVVGFETNDTPLEISQVLKQIEAEHDRTRGKEQFESRTLDLDLLLYGDLVMQMDGVNVPHPDIMRYNFVLKPLAELAAETQHPENEKSIEDIMKQFKKNGEMKIVKYDFE